VHRRYSAVGSAINAYEALRLGICRNHCIDGFKPYVALDIVDRNLYGLGAILLGERSRAEQGSQKARSLNLVTLLRRGSSTYASTRIIGK
jgi:hypothetical protein